MKVLQNVTKQKQTVGEWNMFQTIMVSGSGFIMALDHHFDAEISLPTWDTVTREVN